MWRINEKNNYERSFLFSPAENPSSYDFTKEEEDEKEEEEDEEKCRVQEGS